MQALSERPLKSIVSKPLAGFDLAAELASARLCSSERGYNVSPRRWGCTILARLLRRVAFPVGSFFTRWYISIRTEGLENLEGLVGPTIFAATHESKIDPFVVLRALPSRWRYRTAVAMGDWVFWEGWFGGRRLQTLRYDLMVLLSNVFTLPTNPAGLRLAFRHVDFLTSKGWSILIFPEGLHTPWLLPFQDGVGWMALYTGLPIVPVYIDGMGAILPHDAHVARPGSVCIRIGRPIPPGGDFRALTKRVEQEVHALREAKCS
jgi:1-acyl-sn-glycerol-3-phosphate acyltransferase